MLESQFKKELIKDLESIFEGCEILKNDSAYKQGFPDFTILWHKNWAILEAKRSAKAPHRPNQDFWVDYGKRNSFGAFIYPENKEMVLDELQQAFRSCR